MKIEKLSLSDIVFVLSLTIACLISYLATVYILHPVVDHTNDSLGGMWAAVATVFVFRSTNDMSLSAAKARLFATSISFVLCLLYLLILPFSAVGMAVLIGLGALIAILLGRREDVITTGITTAVVMVVAEFVLEKSFQHYGALTTQIMMCHKKASQQQLLKPSSPQHQARYQRVRK